jgi:hypothetical protein
VLAFFVPLNASAATPSIAAATAALTRHDGLIPVFTDPATGHVLLLFPPPSADGVLGHYLYQTYLRAGLGSNPVGLDRSKPAATQIIVFRRAGDTIFAEYENTAFTAAHGSPDEQQAVAESFATSIVWSAPIAAADPNGAVLIDIGGFLTRDVAGVTDALTAAHQGAFKLDAGLSFPDPAATQTFADNDELEARETFTSDAPGDEVQGIVPDPHHVTLAVHHSFIRLPPPGFTPRAFDPRVNTFDVLTADYSAPLTAPLVTRLATRFRLEKTNPAAARSPVKKPIVFYVDRAAPEPIRTALQQGAAWWAQAFDAAGFIDAFQVRILPAGVSPLDARYNVINWVHRQTRGWSYGQPIVDPRTGEIVRGSVLLGSLRVRQDRTIFEGLEGAGKTGAGGPNDPIVISLARLRQLAVHETGHALGFSHNFAGSTYKTRASVMDYPPPRIGIVNGQLDFSDAYQVGVGDWDKVAVAWLYAEPSPGADEQAALNALVRNATAAGLRFVGDSDSRSPGSAHPLGNLWDDGPDAVAALDHVLQVRALALSRFGLRNLPAGVPVANLKLVLVPIYLFHRYEVTAASKLIGGVDFTYAVNGDGTEAAHDVSGPDQRRALQALLATLDPSLLDLPDPLLHLLSAARNGDPGESFASGPDKQYSVEVFGNPNDPVFDLPSAAAAAAELTFSALLNPARLNRVLDQGSRDPGALTLASLLDQTIAAVFPAFAPKPGHAAEIRRRIQARLLVDLARATQQPSLAPAAAAEIDFALTQLGTRLAAQKPTDPADAAQAHAFATLLHDPSHAGLRSMAQSAPAAEPPPGMPIGEDDDCWLCGSLAAQ